LDEIEMLQSLTALQASVRKTMYLCGYKIAKRRRFLEHAYPTDAIKGGEIIWQR
jgi:hypothetical protein